MKLFRQFQFPSSEADKLGIFLKISPAKMIDFRFENLGRVDRFMIVVIQHWLETSTNASWTKLADGVEHCKYPDVAKELRSMNRQGH